MHNHVLDRAHLALGSGLLSELPLRYTLGEIAMHAKFGPCQVIRAEGTRRFIEYYEPRKMPEARHLANCQDPTLMWAEEAHRQETWVDVDDLRWMDMQFMAVAEQHDNDLGFVRLAWLKTLDEDTKRQYTWGIDYAALRFERED